MASVAHCHYGSPQRSHVAKFRVSKRAPSTSTWSARTDVCGQHLTNHLVFALSIDEAATFRIERINR